MIIISITTVLIHNIIHNPILSFYNETPLTFEDSLQTVNKSLGERNNESGINWGVRLILVRVL